MYLKIQAQTGHNYIILWKTQEKDLQAVFIKKSVHVENFNIVDETLI